MTNYCSACNRYVSPHSLYRLTRASHLAGVRWACQACFDEIWETVPAHVKMAGVQRTVWRFLRPALLTRNNPKNDDSMWWIPRQEARKWLENIKADPPFPLP